jgi:hypothetical protein
MRTPVSITSSAERIFSFLSQNENKVLQEVNMCIIITIILEGIIQL